MGKKISLPAELRGAKIGCGWYEDYVQQDNNDTQGIAVSLLKDKLTEIWNKVAEKRRLENERK